MTKRRLVISLVVVVTFIAAFVYWVATAELVCDSFTVPGYADPYNLVGIGIRFPSGLYSRLVRLEDAVYDDQQGRLEHVRVWVDESPTYGCTNAHESTIPSLRDFAGYSPNGRIFVASLFKLKNNAYNPSSANHLHLPSGPYSVTIHYRVLGLRRTAVFVYP